MDLSDYREQYEGEELPNPMPHSPWELLKSWIKRAINEKKIFEPNAMSLATVNSKGHPSLRIVLFKEVREGGIVFYTNYDSRKGREIFENPHVAATIWWPEIYRQVRLEGVAQKVSERDSTEYFHSRPKGSQLSAVASSQSSVLESKSQLLDRLAKLKEKYKDKDKVDRPENWGGYLIKAESIEFWQGQPDRLHDRMRYQKNGLEWKMERLAP